MVRGRTRQQQHSFSLEPGGWLNDELIRFGGERGTSDLHKRLNADARNSDAIDLDDESSFDSEYLHNLALACAGVSFTKGKYGVVDKGSFDFRAKIIYSGKKQEAVLLRIPICRLADARKAGVAYLIEEALIACAAVTRTNTISTPWTAVKPDPKADSFL